MSKNFFSRRALIVVVPAFAALGCAARTPQPPMNNTDASTIIGNSDGKTLEDLFAGRFPGVTATRVTGGGLQIRIRGGSNSFYGSNEPLYVVDDTPLEPSSGGIVFLNPDDIAKIEVLKNPADIGIYGVRGSNGVVKITTKRAGRH